MEARHQLDRAMLKRALSLIIRSAHHLPEQLQNESHSLLTEFQTHETEPDLSAFSENNHILKKLNSTGLPQQQSKHCNAVSESERRPQFKGSVVVPHDGPSMDGGGIGEESALSFDRLDNGKPGRPALRKLTRAERYRYELSNYG